MMPQGFLGALATAISAIRDRTVIPRIKRELGHGKSSSYTKKGPGRQHRSGPVRPSLSRLPEFGVDARGNPITELPEKYMHSAAKGWRGLRKALEAAE